MKKVIELKKDMKVMVELKEVENISTVSVEKEQLLVLSMMGQAIIDGKLRTGDIREFLPETEIGKTLKALWSFNQNYSFGTKNQMDILSENNIYFNLKDRNSFNQALECLNQNKLLNDRGVTFGKRTLVNPLPNDIISLAKGVVA